MKRKSKAVFLDRDGVIIEETGYGYKIEDLKLIKNAVEGLKLLKDYRLFIITNQSGIGKGIYKIKDFIKYNNYLLKELKKRNISIEKTYYCPHKPEDNCSCRKPKAKFLKSAEKEFNLDIKKSFTIGDKKIDVELGKNAGCKSVLVLTGYGAKSQKSSKPDYTAKDLLDAAKWILEVVDKNTNWRVGLANRRRFLP